jgi:hypothetical protein
MFSIANMSRPRLSARTADPSTWPDPRAVTGSTESDPLALPWHMRLGLAFFSTVAIFASITAGLTALYVFWVVSQDFSV